MWSDLELHLKVIMQPKTVPFTIFLDDSQRNFVASQKILGLLVHSSDKTPDEIPSLTYAAKRMWFQQKLNETYDSASGIPTKAFYLLAELITLAQVDRIVLDWDKTLSVHSSFKAQVISKHVMEGYFGGYKRMKAIRHFFKRMRLMKIPVLVLTANGRARYDKQAFSRGLKFVGAEWVPIQFTDMTKTGIINRM